MFFLDCDKYCKRRESVIVNAIPTGGPKPLANVGMEISPIVTVDVIKPVSTCDCFECFFFFASFIRTSISPSQYA